MYKLYTDGGSRGNPGPAGVGGLLFKDNKLIIKFSEYIGEATNNQAEYKALIKGLELAKKRKIEEIECFLDSELIVNQMNRRFKIKDKDLGSLFVKVWNLSLGFKKIIFTHIDRQDNKLADKLVNQALDKHLK